LRISAPLFCGVSGLILRGQPNMKNSSSTCTDSNASSTQKCGSQESVQIGTANIAGLINPRKTSIVRVRSIKKPNYSSRRGIWKIFQTTGSQTKTGLKTIFLNGRHERNRETKESELMKFFVILSSLQKAYASSPSRAL